MPERNRPHGSTLWGLRPIMPFPLVAICFQQAPNICRILDFELGKLLPFVGNQVFTTFRREWGWKSIGNDAKARD
jgi:hypothetical protein